jgi:hypothetical protein
VSETPCKPAQSAAVLRLKALELLRKDDPAARLAPLLPDRWPDPRGARFYAYHIAPLPTGVVAYAVSGPVARIDFARPDAAPALEHLKPARKLGREDDPLASGAEVTPQALAVAEQALLEVIAGCQRPEGAPAQLEPYRAWLAAHPRIAEDLGKREPAFLAWILKRAL